MSIVIAKTKDFGKFGSSNVKASTLRAEVFNYSMYKV